MAALPCRSIAIMHIPADRAKPCVACPAGTSPHRLTHRIKYVTPYFRVEEDVCTARLFERQEHILLNDEPTADIDDETLERFAAAKIAAMRAEIARLEAGSAKGRCA